MSRPQSQATSATRAINTTVRTYVPRVGDLRAPLCKENPDLRGRMGRPLYKEKMWTRSDICWSSPMKTWSYVEQKLDPWCYSSLAPAVWNEGCWGMRAERPALGIETKRGERTQGSNLHPFWWHSVVKWEYRWLPKHFQGVRVRSKCGGGCHSECKSSWHLFVGKPRTCVYDSLLVSKHFNNTFVLFILWLS